MVDSGRSGEIVVRDLPVDRWLVTLKPVSMICPPQTSWAQSSTRLRHRTMLVIDLRQTSFMDSSIVRVQLEADRTATSSPCEHFALVAPDIGHVGRLFDLVGVWRVFQVFGSEEAFAHFDISDGMTSDVIERWMTRKQRIVKNEQGFRDYNNRRLEVEPVEASNDVEMIPFLCECGDRDCVGALLLTADDFTRAHSSANVFIVKPGHVYHEVERIVSDHGYDVVDQKADMQPPRQAEFRAIDDVVATFGSAAQRFHSPASEPSVARL